MPGAPRAAASPRCRYLATISSREKGSSASGSIHAVVTFAGRTAQDALAWESQGALTDRSQEHLGFSDRGIADGVHVNCVLPGPVMTGRRRSYLQHWAPLHNMTVEEATARFPQEAGIALKLSVIEFATALQEETKGNFEAFLIGWSGRIDPDGNLYNFQHSTGALNYAKYHNDDVDRLLDQHSKEWKAYMRSLGSKSFINRWTGLAS